MSDMTYFQSSVSNNFYFIILITSNNIINLDFFYESRIFKKNPLYFVYFLSLDETVHAFSFTFVFLIIE